MVDKHDPDDAAAWGWEGEWWMSIWVDLPVAERFLPNQKVEASRCDAQLDLRTVILRKAIGVQWDGIVPLVCARQDRSF